jgi:ubiquinone/menaquinone biosynthesis C-methylase UbiE
MKQERIIETNEGIQDRITVEEFDVMQRHFRDRRILETEEIIKSGIRTGLVVEIGPGPGYLGLEWLKATSGTRLVGVEISPAMIELAKKNCADYGLGSRASYLEGNAASVPLEDNSADHVFSNGSLHEWEDPAAALNEIHRVLKPGGILFISDLKRDLNRLLMAFMRFFVPGKRVKQGFVTSVRAAYTQDELVELMHRSPFDGFKIRETAFGLTIRGTKG